MPCVLKARVTEVSAKSLSFRAQKVMYGGKHVSVGDEIFLFDSEHEGGRGLVAAGIVTYVKHLPKEPGVERQTSRVTITVKGTALPKGRPGRTELRAFRGRGDGRAETERPERRVDRREPDRAFRRSAEVRAALIAAHAEHSGGVLPRWRPAPVPRR